MLLSADALLLPIVIFASVTKVKAIGVLILVVQTHWMIARL